MRVLEEFSHHLCIRPSIACYDHHHGERLNVNAESTYYKVITPPQTFRNGLSSNLHRQKEKPCDGEGSELREINSGRSMLAKYLRPHR